MALSQARRHPSVKSSQSFKAKLYKSASLIADRRAASTSHVVDSKEAIGRRRRPAKLGRPDHHGVDVICGLRRPEAMTHALQNGARVGRQREELDIGDVGQPLIVDAGRPILSGSCRVRKTPSSPERRR
jgi:hypothetical protein